MKKILLFIIVLFVGVIWITGCDKTEEVSEENNIDSNVIGTWEHDEDSINAVYIFKEDGTGSYTITVEGNAVEKEVAYYTKDGKLFINFDKDPDTFELEYSIRGNSLVVIDSLGEEVIYNKK